MDAISRKPQISFPITKNRNLQENISVLDSKPLCSQGHNSSSIYDGFNVLHSTSRWAFHLESIWLFTLSDLKTIVGPETSFGLISAISAQAFGLTPSSAPPYGFILRRAWIVAFWTWINLLPFAIDNQRQPASIQEDMVNKPWRPMPSRRLTPKTAKTLMLGLYPIAVAVSFAFGGLTQCVALVLLGFWYNDYGGADNGFAWLLARLPAKDTYDSRLNS
ncbi:hypothetical protein G7Y89_g8849 [Cudoniella acicularis]|uniref:Uncharacterized protein n=1 Tax=Cudoniella acicularis TaxID=354080 RepID=A0A8H4RHF0_9HELO|nr:hypothetical protein G7Y89_g8849 [Cudoniella acicularis]